jgi:hypothetical protein
VQIRKQILFSFFVGIIGILFTSIRTLDAFPVAAIDVSKTKKEALELAKQYSKVTNFGTFDEAQVHFADDHTAMTFLEHQVGINKANQLMRNQIPVWHWRVRLHKTGSDDMFTAEIGTNGELQSLERKVPKELSMKSISQDEAKKLCYSFASNAINVDLKTWRLVTESQNKLKSRTDHSFVWEDTSQDFAKGRLRISSSVCGNRM